ncbi:MAG: transcriptional antiterminator, Rof [Gammaproteobacteria bacterium]|nr:transcriptional antiterminator, Rof [Gammaproteobacteria bacterium]
MTDDIEPYKPIACGLYSEYELAIMRRIHLRLGWVDAQGQQYIGNVLPLDLQTRERVEYLLVRAIDGARHEIRLDKIISSNVREAVAQ